MTCRFVVVRSLTLSIYDAIVEFGALTTTIVEGIVDKFIAELNAQLKKRKVKVAITEKARGYLAQMGYDKEMGARPLGRVIQEKLKDPLTDEMLFGRLSKGGSVMVDFAEGSLEFSYGAA